MLKGAEKERTFYIIMAIIVAIAIFYGSTIITTAGERIGINLSMFYHAGIFFAFSFFLTLSLIRKNIDKKTFALVFLISLAYALSDEFHQLFVPGRFASLKDALIDLTGSLLSVLTLKTVEEFQRDRIYRR